MNDVHENKDFHSTSNIEIFPTWESMKLKPELLEHIKKNGWEKPSPIQSRAIIPISKGKSVLMQSQNGSGKTATFLIGSLQRLNLKSKYPELIILSPIRELALQTESILKSLGADSRSCIGGNSLGDDVKALKKGVFSISGTPGRILQLIREHNIDKSQIKTIILDEADEMLTSFKRIVHDIFEILRDFKPQIIIVTATVSEDVLELTTAFLTNYIKLLVPRDELTLTGIDQYLVEVEKEEWKFDALIDLYQSVAIERTVIFVNTREKGEWLKGKMESTGFTISLAHGHMSMEEREKITNEFKVGETRVLIATDIWSRGIDVSNVTLVINFDIPTQTDTYLHRIGRSGRFGRKGIAITFSSGNIDKKKIKKIEEYFSSKIKILPSDLDSLYF